jgi:hypothetical protein
VLVLEMLEERAVPAITFSPATLPHATVGAQYSQAITGSGGTAPYQNFTIKSGALPGGITLSTSGTLSGKPTAAGTFNFTVQATDSAATPVTGSHAYTLTANAPTITLSPNTLRPVRAGANFSQTIRASGGTAPFKFSFTSGSLPAGVTLSTSGTLSGTPHTVGTFQFTVKATDSSTGTGSPFSASKSYTLSVIPARLVFTSQLPRVAVNGALPVFGVEALDAANKPLKGVTVSLKLVTLGSIGTAGFTAGSIVQAVTGSNGVATFAGVAITTRGVYEIEAEAGFARAFSNLIEVGLNGRHSPG